MRRELAYISPAAVLSRHRAARYYSMRHIGLGCRSHIDIALINFTILYFYAWPYYIPAPRDDETVNIGQARGAAPLDEL